MDTTQLIDILLKDKYAKKNFCGVIPLDHLPSKKLTHDCSFIVNSDKSHEKGQHWFAIYAPLNGYVEYFDPFGLRPIHEEIYDFINKNSNNFIYNNQQIQHLSSNKCGLFCLFFILTRSRGIPIEVSIKFFNKISKFNDEIIVNIFKKSNLKFYFKHHSNNKLLQIQ